MQDGGVRRACLPMMLALLGSCAQSPAAPAHRLGPSAPRPIRTTSASPGPSHIVVIILENHEYSSVIGSSDAPYLNKLASRYVLLTGSYAITHPSLPNYLALTGGSTFGISSDCTTCSVHRSNLVDQLERAGV